MTFSLAEIIGAGLAFWLIVLTGLVAWLVYRVNAISGFIMAGTMFGDDDANECDRDWCSCEVEFEFELDDEEEEDDEE